MNLNRLMRRNRRLSKLATELAGWKPIPLFNQ